MPFTRTPLHDEIEQRLDHLSQRIKSLAGIGLNDAAKWLEPFAARLLNAVYGWNLADPAPGNPITKGIDLADVTNKVAVQVSVQESAEKITHTKAMLADGKLAHFTTIAVFFCHHKKHKNHHGLRVINISTLLGDLAGKDLAVLQDIITILDTEISRHTPDNSKKEARLDAYLAGLVTAFQGYDEIGIEKGKEGEDQSPPIWSIFVPPACTAERACAPAEMEAAQRADEPSTPATALLPLLADSKNRRHVLLGDPGMGKSTLIQRLTAGIASGQTTPGATALDSCLPVPIILRDIVPHLPADPADWTWSTLCETLRTKYQRSEDAPCLYSPWADLRSLRDELLSDPRAFFLVDGLDEIGDLTKRTALRDAIWEGFRTCPGARWLVTSRIVGYEVAEVHEAIAAEYGREDTPQNHRNTLVQRFGSLIMRLRLPSDRADWAFVPGDWVSATIATRLYLAPFDDSQQDAFVTNWFRARKAPNTPPGLLGDIRSREHEGIRVLARVPNLLSYMAILKRDGKPLPDGRADLYMAIARAYLFGIDKSYRLSKTHGHDCPIPFEGRLRLLAILAGEMQHRRAADAAAQEAEIKARRERGERVDRKRAETDGNITISGHDLRALLRTPLAGLLKDCDVEQELTDFLHFIVSRSGLLLDRGTAADGGTLFGFTHLSFLEFFAACYLRAELEHENALMLAALRARKSPDDPAFAQTYLAK